MLLTKISHVHFRKKRHFLPLCYHRMCFYRSGKIWPLCHLKTQWKIPIRRSHQNSLFFPLFSDNFWLFTIHLNFFSKVIRGRRRNGTLNKRNAQPDQQNWFWHLSMKKIRFVTLNWISDNRDFRICKHFLICPIHVSCH